MKLASYVSLAKIIVIATGFSVTVAEAGLFNSGKRAEKVAERAAASGMSFQEAFRQMQKVANEGEVTSTKDEKPGNNKDSEEEQNPGVIGQDGQGAGTNNN